MQSASALPIQTVILPARKINPIIASMVRHSARSWWQARYSDGKVVSEWNTLTTTLRLPLGLGRSSRWEDVNKKNMTGLRLLCPNGMVGEIESPEGYRFIQLKQGFLDVGIGGNAGGRSVAAHIIGVITNPGKGDCFCRAWEYEEQRLIQFEDNIFNIKYRNIGKLNLQVQGVRL